VNASFGAWIALNADGLARTFARAGIGLSALAANGKAAHVTDTAIALNALQTFEVHADFAAQIAFDDILAILDRVNDLRELLLAQVFRPDARVNFGFGQNLNRVCGADAIYITERDINALVRRNLYTNDTCHKLSLPLLVAFVAANDPNDAFAPHNLAVFAKFFD
jgi:hypothetical protein